MPKKPAIYQINRPIIALLLFSASLFAIDTKVSGFATLGATISNKDYTYEKYVDDSGTLRRDTLAGLQLDTIFNEQWGATVQGKIAQSQENDDHFEPTLPWAFLSYRPANHWLIRAGKVRIPYYLNSQNQDVGVTYDNATLPKEVYNLSPYDNGTGGIVTKTFNVESASVDLDLFYIHLDITTRQYITGIGPIFTTFDLDVKGTSLSCETDENNVFRGGYYHTSVSGLNIDILTLGMDYNFQDKWRLMSEYTGVKIEKFDNYHAGYVSVLKSMDNWTPYITYAFAQPWDTGRESIAVGTSYSINYLQKLKAELKYTRLGNNPYQLIDIELPSNNYAYETPTLFSFSYNIAF